MDEIYRTDSGLVVVPAYYDGGVPVFKPTMAEFRDFYKYNKAINKYGMQSGIAKVIPPVEWTELLQGTYTHENLEHVRIKNPIVQNMNVTAGHQGVYSLQNVEKQRSYDIFQWKDLSLKPNFVPPAAKKTRRGLSTPISKCAEHSNKDESTDSARVTPNQEAANRLLKGDFNVDASEFSPERCEELEQLYWKSLGYAEPMYGADVLGSIFLERTKSWNVAHLPNILDLMEEKVPGVNDAYLYAGLWKASFSWHLEDQDLYSINYLHFGAPKQWYSIPQSENAKFYALMKDIFSEDYKNCPEFLRHKTFLASPQFLFKHGITCNHIIHRQGEFMITYPYGYHAGFNYGFNLAESVNFALDNWFEFAPKTQKCECVNDSVGINYKQIYCKFKGLPYVPELPTQTIKEPLNERETLISSPPTLPRKTARRKLKLETADQECALCPNNLPESLKQFVQFELLDTDVLNPQTHSPLQVHRVCAKAFPKELHIRRASRSSKATERVGGLLNISKLSRNQKCVVCHVPNRVQSTKMPPHGACFSCSAHKCSRSFHATCALGSGALLDACLCKHHRASAFPYYDSNSTELTEKLETLPANSLVQFTLTRGLGKRQWGDVYCGLITFNSKDDETLQIKVYPSLEDEIEVQYKDVLIGNVGHFDNAQFVSMESVSIDKQVEDILLARSPKKRQPDVASLHILKRATQATQAKFPATFGLSKNHYELSMGQPRLVMDEVNDGVVFINKLSEHTLGHTPKPSRFRFVEESFNDNERSYYF